MRALRKHPTLGDHLASALIKRAPKYMLPLDIIIYFINSEVLFAH